MNQIQTLKGFRDFLPAEKRARDYVAKKIIETFEVFGFEPLETPTLEYASLLTGKYGDEADKLLYTFTDRGGREVGLRYDQTVPTARVLSQYQNDLPQYFRRYQIQNVFRADKPQKGRYREFTQCDADIYGAKYAIGDAEILAVFYSIYRNLGLDDIVIELNDRDTLIKLLTPYATESVSVESLIQSLDKLDKMSADLVIAELTNKGLPKTQARQALETVSTAQPSVNLQDIIGGAKVLGVPESNLKFNPTLARGLDYYTGMIFEGKIPGEKSSVGGGGRYDKLIEQLGGPSIPAVGFGIGFDRTVEVLQSRNLLNDLTQVQILVSLFSEYYQGASMQITQLLRQAGIRTELYINPKDRLDKQLKYANKKQIPFVAIIGTDEVEKNVVTLKNMTTGEQITGSLKETITQIKAA